MLSLLGPAPALAAGQAPAAKPKPPAHKLCDAKRVDNVYAIGSSTMGMSLGRILKRQLKQRGARVRVWGKASSGLARPDFHDWVKVAPGLMKRHRPDAVVVSLGTNDGQNLKEGKHWYTFGGKRWKRVYRARVDALLNALAGKDRRRPIVWLGPTALPDRKGFSRMRTVSAVIAERVAKFNAAGGHAAFIDGIRQTTRAKGGLVAKVRPPGKKRSYAARAPDNVHLTRAGVRWLLAEPVLRRLRPCVGQRTASAKR